MLLVFIIVTLMLGVTSWLFTDALIPLQQATLTSTPAMLPASPESWIIIDLPPDASQLEYVRKYTGWSAKPVTATAARD